MLLLLFYLGDVLFAIKCDKIREITPVVNLKIIQNCPAFLAGIFNYRGSIVPVIDMRQLINGVPCRMKLSTRIILINYEKSDKSQCVVGLMAERVTEAVMRPPEYFVPFSVNTEKKSYLSGMVMDDDRMIEHIDLELLDQDFAFITGINYSFTNDDSDFQGDLIDVT